ncbi:hypothetical protein TcYC6_0002590 [Trypanosoma cruzi]|nr:hypothetical protein TcYC6_0002590 [Trypanosoma cruzi]
MVSWTSFEDGSALCGSGFGGGSDGPPGASTSAAVGGDSSDISFSSGAFFSSAPPCAGAFVCSAAPAVDDRKFPESDFEAGSFPGAPEERVLLEAVNNSCVSAAESCSALCALPVEST